MENFQNILQECELLDMGFSGYLYTWSNKRIGRYLVQERLDRFMFSRRWESLGFFSYVSHLVSWCSDHCPILLTCKTSMTDELQSSFNTHFHYELFWKDYAECRDIIMDCWKELVDRGEDHVSIFQQNISRTTIALSQWSKGSLKGGRKRWMIRLQSLKRCKTKGVSIWMGENFGG